MRKVLLLVVFSLLSLAQPARAQEPFTVDHDPPHHSHSRGYGRDHGISR